MIQITKNKIYQSIFFLIVALYVFSNGGNSNLFIQINFIIFSVFFLFCLKDKNYYSHFKYFFIKNKISIFLYLLFLLYLVFQIIPIPLDLLKFFSYSKFEIANKLKIQSQYSSISLSSTDTYFQIINYLTLMIALFVFKIIFYKEKHFLRLHYFISFVGLLASVIAILFYLNGNPDFLFFKNSQYKGASTGFFINRTVFSIFLIFCVLSCLLLLKTLPLYNNDNFIKLIYIRLFLVFITVGIVTTFSRIGNFLLLITILSFLVYEIFYSKNKNYVFRLIIIILILFDLIILGIYFGTDKIIDRFLFLKEEFTDFDNIDVSIHRLELIKFSLLELKNYILFGYGAGSYHIFFQTNFDNPFNLYANHAHSDIIEFFGEFGLIGFILIISSFLSFFLKKRVFNLNYFVLYILSLTILTFDFSLHVPLIQLLFIIYFVSAKKITQLS